MKFLPVAALLGYFVVEVVSQSPFRLPENAESTRVVRQAKDSSDQMVENILQWLQGMYTKTRRTRQNNYRGYLPPSNTEKPRPFQPSGANGEGTNPEYSFTGYPLPGSSPQPPFPDYTRPPVIIPSAKPEENGIFSSTQYPSASTPFPSVSTGYPSVSTGYPSVSTGYPSVSTEFTSSTGYPSPTTGYPSVSTGFPSISTGYPSSTNYPSTGYPSTGYPSSTGKPLTIPTRPPYVGPDDSDSKGSENTGGVTARPDTDDDDKHPPHIHAIDVECAKDMMTINLEFNKVYNGIIYSKGFYNNPACRYVNENSNRIKYTFTVNLNSCGTEFINAFDTQGQSYLENVLVLQNEASIQEVWDTIRSVRCLWEGNLNKALSVALSVGMLNQEIVTFSGDTAMASLDIQLGRGPFAQPANGLVKIGETMTLVVSVTGDPGFDIQVQDCYARDSAKTISVQLTDKNGCVLKPKLFGAFQKTRNTNSAASIIAYAFFNAFKFPDMMDLVLECNIELCKTDCEVCPDPSQKLEPGRRKRDVSAANSSIADPIVVGKMLRVIIPEDLSENAQAILNLESVNNVCLSMHGFVFTSGLLVSLLTASCIFSAYTWLRFQRLNVRK